jgi:hypothetical protein
MYQKGNHLAVVVAIIMFILGIGLGYLLASSDSNTVSYEEVLETLQDQESEDVATGQSVEQNTDNTHLAQANIETSPTYLRSMTQDGPHWNTVVDYIQILPYQQGDPNPMGEIVNQNPQLRTFIVTPDTEFIFQTREHNADGGFRWNESVSLPVAINALFTEERFMGNTAAVPFTITVDLDTNEVISLVEIYTS